MKEQQNDITKLEFLMTVNDNFIVQRFFNVKDYNPKAKNSVELLGLLEYFVEDMKQRLKMKSVSYMSDNQYEIIENQVDFVTPNNISVRATLFVCLFV